MGRYLTKRMMFLLLTLTMLLPLLIPSSSSVNSNKNGVSIAKEGGFTPFVSEGKLPKLVDLEFEDLNLCSLATYGEAVKDCLDLFEGIQSGTLHMCASFCDRVFEACSDAYFSSDATNQVIVPCGASETIICGKATKWESNGTAFCYALGFTVQTADDSAQEPCHGSKSSLEPPVAVVKEPLIKTEFLALQISWLVTVLGLQTMLLKRWRYQQQMRALIQRMREER
ncbi:hypothetical protein N665_1142s0003 [Sinapis alba]|nr:hypothetical protein N665_1142s0003 [Sinapis alba]